MINWKIIRNVNNKDKAGLIFFIMDGLKYYTVGSK